MIMHQNDILIIKRNVKHPRIELKTGSPILILPKNGNFSADKIINDHKKWLEEKLCFIQEIKEKYENNKIYNRSKEELIELIGDCILRYSDFSGRYPEIISFRYMKTKWASCTRKGKITFNLLLKYLPTELINYIVFHEMAHLLIPNHSKYFWSLLEKKFSNCKKYEESLFGYWFLLLKKLNIVEID